MARTLSQDLRDRVVAAIDGGLSCHAAAARFGVSVSSAIRWVLKRVSLESFARRAGRTERLPNCVYRFEILVKSRVTMLVSASRVISKTNRSWQTPIHGSI